MSKLIITNGDMAAERIREAGFGETVLPWRDVLHDGPVLLSNSLKKTSERRAIFLSAFADVPLEDVQREFRGRDQTLLNSDPAMRIELWFEHDLYDQLQLFQLLYVFSTELQDRDVFLVQTDDYLSEISDADFLHLPETVVKISPEQKAYGKSAWEAFTSSIPDKLRVMAGQTAPLSSAQAALQRLLGEFPNPKTGLSHSLFLALTPLLENNRKIKDLFLTMQEGEEAKFMGDLSFARALDGVVLAQNPLLA